MHHYWARPLAPTKILPVWTMWSLRVQVARLLCLKQTWCPNFHLLNFLHLYLYLNFNSKQNYFFVCSSYDRCWNTTVVLILQRCFEAMKLLSFSVLSFTGTNWFSGCCLNKLEHEFEYTEPWEKMIASFALQGECLVKVKYPHHILGSTITVVVPFIANGKEQAPLESH